MENNSLMLAGLDTNKNKLEKMITIAKGNSSLGNVPHVTVHIFAFAILISAQLFLKENWILFF